MNFKSEIPNSHYQKAQALLEKYIYKKYQKHSGWSVGDGGAMLSMSLDWSTECNRIYGTAFRFRQESGMNTFMCNYFADTHAKRNIGLRPYYQGFQIGVVVDSERFEFLEARLSSYKALNGF